MGEECKKIPTEIERCPRNLRKNRRRVGEKAGKVGFGFHAGDEVMKSPGIPGTIKSHYSVRGARRSIPLRRSVLMRRSTSTGIDM
jgi:hypothetical protein